MKHVVESEFPPIVEDHICDFCSIIIITFNEENFLPQLLNSLHQQTYKNFEIIVVDSNSTDKTVEIAKAYKNRFSDFSIIELSEAKGPAFGRNCGAKQAKHERLIFFDADTYLKPDFIQKLLLSINKKSPDVATCRIRIAEGGIISNFGAVFLNSFMIGLHPIYSSAYGACFISTRSVHSKLDGFWEHLAVCEDCNYVKRARRVYGYRFKILNPIFYTSDRRAHAEGGVGFLFKYIRIHLFRMTTGKEFLKGALKYEYGGY